MVIAKDNGPFSNRVLVTGGAGFIGSHLCEQLLAAGQEVLCVDNFFTGRRWNVAHLADHPNFELQRHDITFPLYVELDQIFNLACPASPVHYQFDPVQTTKTSVVGAINMLGLAKRLKNTHPASLDIGGYGDPTVHPQPESYWGNVNPIGPRSCYDEGKRCAETLFFDYRRQHNLNTKSFGSSIRMAQGCIHRMAVLFRTLSCRRCAGRISPSTAMARRPAHSATSMILSKGCSR